MQEHAKATSSIHAWADSLSQQTVIHTQGFVSFIVVFP